MTDSSNPARIRLGMVGGGNDAFIGAVHRIASRIDDRYELLAGALSSTAEKSQSSGKAIGLPRIYDDFKSMAERESKLEDGIEAVSIVTPNHVHFAAASEFLKRGIHVICDKPLTSTLEDAKALVKVAEESDALFILTHNYTGYPMVRQAREMVANEVIGKVRVVQVEYPQDWLTTHQDFKQAEWALIRSVRVQEVQPVISALMLLILPASSVAFGQRALRLTCNHLYPADRSTTTRT